MCAQNWYSPPGIAPSKIVVNLEIGVGYRMMRCTPELNVFRNFRRLKHL